MPLPYRSGNSIQLIRGGADFFEALHALIEGAAMSVHLQVYSLEPDTTGAGVIERLKAAVRRGVQVYVVLDAFGSQALSEAVLQELRAAGIWVRKYSPIFRGIRFRIGQRLHHKVIVADQRLALTGGINLADKYCGLGEAAWLDYAVQIRGPLCQDLLRYCTRFWPAALRLRMPVFSPADKAGDAAARLTRNDLRVGMQEITETYRRAIGGAAREVLLLSPYFIPGLRLRKALAAARKRGVRVTLIVPGISDVPMIQRAMEYLYDWLLEIGVEVWEWDQSILHGKVLVVDGQWVSIVSYNPNALSDYFSLELNVDIRDPRFAGQMQAELTERVLPQCAALTAVKIRSRFTWMRRLAQSIAYYLLWMACRLAIPDARLLEE
ncbi:MAG: phospholipase D-like domain-containing protein [Saprospiraceae bacterium]